MTNELFCLLCVFCLVNDGACQGYGEACYHFGPRGVCVGPRDCYTAFDKAQNVQICGYTGDEYIFCCLNPSPRYSINTIIDPPNSSSTRPNTTWTLTTSYNSTSTTSHSYHSPNHTFTTTSSPNYNSTNYSFNATTSPSYNNPNYTITTTTSPSYNSPNYTFTTTSSPSYNSPKYTFTSTINPTYTTSSINSTSYNNSTRYPRASYTNPITTTASPVATTPQSGSSTTEYIPPVYDYVTNEPLDDGCATLGPNITAEKTGRKAWDKCIEYQQLLVYPCERSVALLGNMVRMNYCSHTAALTNEIARPNEFPHMVVLAVRTSKKLRWMCSGTLISERFILSSAWCWERERKTVKPYAILGALQRIMTGIKTAYQEHRIESIIRYPQFGKLVKYHNIALLKTKTVIQLNRWTIPACLDVARGHYAKAMATRWRDHPSRAWNANNRLEKISLRKLTKKECQQTFSSIRNWKLGNVKVSSQICYKPYSPSNDTCKETNEQGGHILHENDGSLTIENHRVNCMYTIIGVSSFGRTCGTATTSTYTRVANYVNWIESVVWPENNT